MLGVAREFSQLRRGNQGGERVRMERERWEEEQKDAREKEREQAERKQRSAEIRKRLFPGRDEFFLPSRGDCFPEDAVACLAASQRLKSVQDGEPDPPQSK